MPEGRIFGHATDGTRSRGGPRGRQMRERARSFEAIRIEEAASLPIDEILRMTCRHSAEAQADV